MRALGKQRDRSQELCDLGVRIAMAEHRQRERRLGDEHVARHKRERRAGRVGNILVVAGRHDGQPVGGDRDLRRTEHMAGGMKCHRDAAELKAFAVGDGLRGAGEIVAVTQPHQIESFLRRQHRAVAGAGMVGMGMGDQRPLDRPRRVDKETARLAAHAGRRRQEDVFRSHDV